MLGVSSQMRSQCMRCAPCPDSSCLPLLLLLLLLPWVFAGAGGARRDPALGHKEVVQPAAGVEIRSSAFWAWQMPHPSSIPASKLRPPGPAAERASALPCPQPRCATQARLHSPLHSLRVHLKRQALDVTLGHTALLLL
jgi:hypothetical protein